MKLRGQKTLALLLALMMLFSLLPAAAMAEDLVEDNVLEEQEPVEQLVEEGPSEPQQTAEDLILVEEEQEEQEETEQPAENAENADNADNAENADNEAEASRNEEKAAETKDESADNAEIAGFDAREEAQLGGISSSWIGTVNVTESQDIDSRITVNGDVTLILNEGVTLNAKQGITVEGNSTLTIEGTGTLIATGVAIEDEEENEFIYPAGIGGYTDDGGTVIINGGKIEATGASGKYGGGAGIGGCLMGLGVNLTINGGVINATGGLAAAGIGSGACYFNNNYTTVTIKGGTVRAYGGDKLEDGYYMGGAGIGGGFGGHGLINIITGGTVTATGGPAAAGIGDGAGYDGDRLGSYTINGGTVTASGGNGGKGTDDDYNELTYGCGAGIGGGYSLTYNADGNHSKNKTYGTFNFDGVTIYVGDSENDMGVISYNGNFGFNYSNMHYQQYVKTVAATPTIAVTGVSLNPSTLNLNVGSVKTLTATISPENATDKTVKWSVGGTNVNAVKLYSDANCSTEVGTDATETLTVYAKGISAGSATITATANDGSGKSGSCTVTVLANVNYLTLPDDYREVMVVGNSGKPTVIFHPDKNVDTSLTWSSSNTNVATVDPDGTIHAVSVGNALITVTATNGTEDIADDKPAYIVVKVKATTPGDYAGYVKNVNKTVKFNDMDWYLIDDNSAVDGTVTLLMKQPPDDKDKTYVRRFNEMGKGTDYSGSEIQRFLESMTAEGGAFADVADAIAPTALTDVTNAVQNAKLYLLSSAEAADLTPDIGKCDPIKSKDKININLWMLRTPYLMDTQNALTATKCVQTVWANGIQYGKLNNQSSGVHQDHIVRPALRIDLRKVRFDTDSSTFTPELPLPVADVTLDQSELKLTTDGVKTLTATISPANATDKTVKWSVGGTDADAVKLYSDANCNTEVGTGATEILTVYAKGMAEGKATITVTSNAASEKYATCEVTVFPEHTHDKVTFQPWTSVNSLPTDGSWYLTEDVFVTEGAIVENDNLYLCLNGKTITFATQGTPSYPGIIVTGGKTLNLYDDSEGGGAITRGAGCSGNGVVLIESTRSEDAKTQFNMYGGTIRGHEIGVYVNDNSNPTFDNGSEFNMYGGAVVNNTISGIYLSDRNAAVTLAGRVNVSGNGYDIDVGSDKVITIAKGFALADSSKKIGVKLATVTKPFTSGFKSAVSEKTPADFFASEDSDYTVGWSADGNEACLIQAVTVTFNANEGTGTMGVQTIPANIATALTANAFTREGYTFNGWNTQADGKGTAYTDKQEVTLTADTTLYAQWKSEEPVTNEVYFDYLQSDYGNFYEFTISIRVPDLSYIPELNLGGFRALSASDQATYDASKVVAYTVSPYGENYYDYKIKVFAQYLDTPIYFKVMHDGEEVTVGKNAADNGDTQIMRVLDGYGTGYSIGDYVRVMALTNTKYEALANSIGTYAAAVQGLK